MSFSGFIHDYGLFALVIGTIFEGEGVVLLAGLAVRQGLLPPVAALCAALMGTVISDQFCFYTGRLMGSRVLQRFPGMRARFDSVRARVENHQTAIIFSFQYFPGLSMIVPFTLGMTRLLALRFLVLDVLSAGLWSGTLMVGGYLFGVSIQPLLEKFHAYSGWLLGCLACLILLLFHWRAVRASKRVETEGTL
jgi:membrane protein DedA with SNARE-associated domain